LYFKLLLIFIGGGFGSCCRYFIATPLNKFFAMLPFGTLAANILSCLVAGILAGWFAKYTAKTSTLQPLLLTGFCGGFSTFSSFALENINFLQKKEHFSAMLYIICSLFLCHLAVAVGFGLAYKIAKIY
jgi:fluoride exporter